MAPYGHASTRPRLTLRLHGIHDDQAVVALVGTASGAAFDAGRDGRSGCRRAAVYSTRTLGHLAVVGLGHPAPEVPRVGLGQRVGRPLVVPMLVLAGQLAAVAAVAFGRIEYEHLHGNSPPIEPASCLIVTPASLNSRPNASGYCFGKREHVHLLEVDQVAARHLGVRVLHGHFRRRDEVVRASAVGRAHLDGIEARAVVLVDARRA